MRALEWIPFSELWSANGHNCCRARNSDRIGCCIEACGPEAWGLIELSSAFRSRHIRRCNGRLSEFSSSLLQRCKDCKYFDNWSQNNYRKGQLSSLEKDSLSVLSVGVITTLSVNGDYTRIQIQG